MKPRLAAAATALAILGGASSASAATLSGDRACYREGSQARLAATGFVPGQPAAVRIDGRQVGSSVTDGAGNFAETLTLGAISRSEAVRSVVASQPTTGLSATFLLRETKVYVVSKPDRFKPGRRLRLRAGGFYGVGRTLYAHVRGPERRNVRIGRLKGPCGKVLAKRRLLKRSDATGFYTVQFDTRRRYVGRRAPLYFRTSFFIRRIIRLSRAGSLASAPLGGERFVAR